MAKGDYYFPLYYKRLLTSTIGWTDSEFGTYLRLLIHQFDNGSIPSDLNKLAKFAPNVKKNWHIISSKFIEKNADELINEVMDEIYQHAQAKKQRNRENGNKGGRKKGSEKKPSGFGLGSKKETEVPDIPITNNQEPIINNQYENTVTPGSEIKFPIARCLQIAKMDPKWVKANKPTDQEISDFMEMLTGTGEHDKNPADFKSHFFHWKQKRLKETNQELAPVKKLVV